MGSGILNVTEATSPTAAHWIGWLRENLMSIRAQFA